MVDAAKEELANARLTDDEEVLENAEKRLKKAERDFEMDKRTVRDRFANEAFFPQAPEAPQQRGDLQDRGLRR